LNAVTKLTPAELELTGPSERYRELVAAGKIKFDPAQRRVATLLQQIHDSFWDKSGGWLRQPTGWLRRPRPVRGLYIHGGVGRGKTLLMDIFVQELERIDVPVQRTHFHRFMDQVHNRLKQMGKGLRPLEKIAAEQRKRSQVICFDEFHVEDIADAMLLGELTRQWFDRDMILVATSNSAPDELYKDGLQRRRFVPAIENLKQHCRVIELDSAEDFRLRELTRHPTWYTPCGQQTDRLLAEEFDDLSPDQPVVRGSLRVRGRDLPIRQRSGSILWAEFSDLCEGNRSAADYIELSFRFSTLIVGNIPMMDENRNNAAKRFIHLVDECYDRAVKLIASAETRIEEVYQGKRLAAPFERTVSRLIEMQSNDYLALPHRP